tara:strand:- start:7549 stop:8373 length:825 start_codon:yes stop_codon:yes gene_type:complete
MYNKFKLDPTNLQPLTCKDFEDCKKNLQLGSISKYTKHDFIRLFLDRLKNIKESNLIGLDTFGYNDLIIGCNHFIDNLIMEYGLQNIQIFEHDYSYYKKILPSIEYTTLDTLTNEKPLIIAAPFPGHLGMHRQYADIIAKCEAKNISVFIDAAWFPSAFDITLDLSSACIKQVAFSCSKAYNLGDNRIGLRLRKNKTYDSITHMNDRNMISKASYQIACEYLTHYPYDYLTTLYRNEYFNMCKTLKLRPSNIIHAAFSLDWKILFGVKKVLSNL